jgi:hypothetical protein
MLDLSNVNHECGSNVGIGCAILLYCKHLNLFMVNGKQN